MDFNIKRRRMTSRASAAFFLVLLLTAQHAQAATVSSSFRIHPGISSADSSRDLQQVLGALNKALPSGRARLKGMSRSEEQARLLTQRFLAEGPKGFASRVRSLENSGLQL